MAIWRQKHNCLLALTTLALLLSLLGLAACEPTTQEPTTQEPTTQTYTLTTDVSPPGAGSVSPSGGSYDAGLTVSLSATAASGYTFDHWSGSAAGTNPTTTITMDSDKDVTAHFEATPTVLFSDDFSQDTGDWDTFSDSNGSVFYENGWLHVINYTEAPFDTYTLSHQHFTDFILEVETKLVEGTDDNWQGVTCRYQDGGNYYAFGVSADGYYLISKFTDGEQKYLAGPTRSSHINQGWDVINVMHIECIGSSLSLSANGHLLKTVTDTTFSGGDMGLIATAWEGNLTEIAFDNIIVTGP
jgi:uncharacterized repeat protein (TIGR02543 family)